MPDFIELEAPSQEEAVFAASAKLGLPESEIQVQLLSQGRGGRVKVRAARKGVVLPAVDPVSITVEPEFRFEKPAERPGRQGGGQAPEPPTPAQAEELRSKVEKMLAALGTPSTVVLVEHLGQPLMQVTGEFEGLLIGKRGANLQALQTLVTAYLNVDERHDSKRLLVDVAGYRAAHENELMESARQYAKQAQEEGGQVATGSLPASDRRIVHLVLKEFPDLESFSVGEGETKRVVIQKKTT